MPGWEQFTALFLFFISEDNNVDMSKLGKHETNRARFVAKLDHEVDATIEALARLETRLAEICGLNEAPPRTGHSGPDWMRRLQQRHSPAGGRPAAP
jgi:hypothetical protein